MVEESSSPVTFNGFTLTRSPDGSRVGLLNDNDGGEAAFSVPSNASASTLMATLVAVVRMKASQPSDGESIAATFNIET